MSYVDHIVEVFGGIRALARAVEKPPSNVSGWKERGTIPDSQKILIFRAARRLKISLTALDLLPYELRQSPGGGDQTKQPTGGPQGNGVSHG